MEDDAPVPMGCRHLFPACFAKSTEMQHHCSLCGLYCPTGSSELPCHHLTVWYVFPVGRSLLLFRGWAGAVPDTTSCALPFPIPPPYLLPVSAIHNGSPRFAFLFLTRTWISEAILRARPNFLQWYFTATWCIYLYILYVTAFRKLRNRKSLNTSMAENYIKLLSK